MTLQDNPGFWDIFYREEEAMLTIQFFYLRIDVENRSTFRATLSLATPALSVEVKLKAMLLIREYNLFMSTKSLIMFCFTIGTLIGSYLPVLFGASVFSYTSILTASLGGIIGIIIGCEIGQDF